MVGGPGNWKGCRSDYMLYWKAAWRFLSHDVKWKDTIVVPEEVQKRSRKKYVFVRRSTITKDTNMSKAGNEKKGEEDDQ